MSNHSNLQAFHDHFSKSLLAGSFIKISLGNYHGNDSALKAIYARRVKIKKDEMLSFTYRYKTRDIIKNFSLLDGTDKVIEFLSNDFRIGTLFISGSEIILEHNKKGAILLRIRSIDQKTPPSLDHNSSKTRLISSNEKKHLVDLKVTDLQGNVLKSAQDKFRQINKYIELLSSLIKDLPKTKRLNVVDMGSGKGYLTFALYDYLHNVLGLDSKVTGVEYGEDLVSLCNGIAVKSGFGKLNFEQGSIQDYDASSIDVLIALHACDTATDDAIFKGIRAGAELIVVAPCCHKQIRKEMERTKIINNVTFLTKHGIFMERQTEMITDGLRAMLLEHEGYKTKVFEFISDIHTPKNVMIVGTKGNITAERKAEIRNQIYSTKAYFGIGKHHLEQLLDIK